MTQTQNILLAAGGTGGHMFPAFALADILRQRGHSVQLITDDRGQRFVAAGFSDQVHILRTGTVTRGGLLFRILAVLGVVQGIKDALQVLRARSIDMVVGFGGYPVYPVMLAARICRVPYVVHEQNTVLGRVNRLVAKRASVVALSFAATSRVPQGAQSVVTGNPVRDAISAIGEKAYVPAQNDERFDVLVVGGSQGAKIFSDVLPATVRLMKHDLQGRLHIVQQCREEDVERVRAAYAETAVNADVRAFITDMATPIEVAKLIITRAGATSLAEVTSAARPALYVPLRIAADDHQTSNAAVVVEAGGGWAMSEDEFTPSRLAAFLEKAMNDPLALTQTSAAARAMAQPEAARHLADVVEGALQTLPKGHTPS